MSNGLDPDQDGRSISPDLCPRHDINADRLSALDLTFASPNLGS